MNASPAPHAGSRILVVDDNDDILGVVRRILERERYRITFARDGEEALRRVEEDRPDLVLLDVMLPRLDGLEVCRRIKADPRMRGIMVLLVTGRGSPESRVRGYDAGADDYITKPFHVAEFLARIRSALRIKGLRDELDRRTRELISSQRALIQQEKMATIGLLAAGIAHEFNNIMSGISGFAQMAQKAPKYREVLVDVALAQAKRAQEITASLSTFARPRDRVHPVSVSEVIERSVQLVDKELRSRKIACERDYAPDLRPVSATEGHLQEVFVNLLINACHAIGREGRIRIAVRCDADRILCTVEDSGTGIPEAIQGKIFDPFFTTKGALGGSATPGTGLGLTVTYNILQALGGGIEVESVEGEGSTFRIELPAASAPLPAAREPFGRPARLPGGLRVLLVEGDPTIRELFRELLAESEVVFAEDGDGARALVRRAPFDFVIVDLGSEGEEDGERTLEAIRDLAPETHLIAISSGLPDPALRARLGPACGHLMKPFDLEDLVRLLSVEAIEAVPGGAP